MNMAAASIEAIRTEAKAAGVPWSWVIAACRELRAQEADAREHANEVRRHAWFLHASAAYAQPFWRIGFRTRFGRLVDAHDYKRIPGYDTLHRELCCRFPEFADDDGCERLWSFLMAPYDPVPRRAALMARALELAKVRYRERQEAEALRFEFGANIGIS